MTRADRRSYGQVGAKSDLNFAQILVSEWHRHDIDVAPSVFVVARAVLFGCDHHLRQFAFDKFPDPLEVSESAFRKTCTPRGYHKKMARSMRESIEESGFSIGPKPWTISEIELSSYDCHWSIREYLASLNYNPDIPTIDLLYVDEGRGERMLPDSEFGIVDYAASLYSLFHKRL